MMELAEEHQHMKGNLQSDFRDPAALLIIDRAQQLVKPSWDR